MPRLFTFVLLVLTPACSAKTSEGSRGDAVNRAESTPTENGAVGVPLQGVYTTGFEASGFQSCDGDELSWLQFDGDAPPSAAATVAAEDLYEGRAFFISGVGDISPPGEYGHLGASDRQVTFTAIDRLVPVAPYSETSEVCPHPEETTILGRVLSPDGTLSTGYAHITVVTFEEWNGEIPNEAAPDFSAVTDDGYFAIRVPPRRWGVKASFGTCSSPLVEAIGEPGDVVDVDLVVNCVE